jgi:hypothetical protein
MTVKELIKKLQKLEDATECDVFVVTRSGVDGSPTVIGTTEGDVYVSGLHAFGRCVMLDTYVPKPVQAART